MTTRTKTLKSNPHGTIYQLTELGLTEIHVRDKDAVAVARGGLTFDLMAKVSEIFGGTKLINVENEDRRGGFCETCEYSYSVAVLVIKNKGKELT